MSNEQMATYLVKGINIRKDGKLYRIGRKIDLTAEEARRLTDFLEPFEGEELSGITQDDIEAMQGRFMRQIEELNGQIEALKNQLFDSESDCDKHRGELSAARVQVSNLEEDLARTMNTLLDCQKELAALKKPAEKGGKK